MKLFLPALVVLVLLLAAPATAQDYERGVNAYGRGDYAAARREWWPLAKRGHLSAQFYLGELYYRGWGVTQDYAEAFKWFHKVAGQRLKTPRAVFDPSYQDIAAFLREHVDISTLTNAQGILGLMYRDGTGVLQDYTEAMKWYRLAAEKGNAPAQASLGQMYIKGQGVPHDSVQGHMWLNLAAAQGLETASKQRDTLTELMAPADVLKAQRMAREWLEAHPQKLAN